MPGHLTRRSRRREASLVTGYTMNTWRGVFEPGENACFKDDQEDKFNMKNRKWLVSAMAVAMIFTAQPVYAAGSDIQGYSSQVVTIGQGPADNNTYVGGNTNPGSGGPGANGPGMGAPGNNAPGTEMPGGPVLSSPDSFPAPGDTQPGGSPAPGGGQTPPGDEGTSLSPVVTAGSGQSDPQQAAAEAAAQQAAAEAAAQQAAAEAAAQPAAGVAGAQHAAAEPAAPQAAGRSPW